MSEPAAENEVETPDGPPPASTSMLRNEDWLAVWLGFGIIFLILSLHGTAAAIELPTFKWATTKDLAGKVFAFDNLVKLIVPALIVFGLSCVGVALLQGRVPLFAVGFWIVYLLAVTALLIAGNADVHHFGLEYVLFALVLGLLVSNLIGLPEWLREAVRTEFFIKTGLVVLGTGILFDKIITTGALGMVQALGVVIVVWFVCFWVARKLKVDDEFATMLSTAVSICGVSAAIAACGAIQGDRRKLSYVTSLVLLVAAPMMVLMPIIVTEAGIPDRVGGAWIGGTLDTTGSVTAAGALISEEAEKVGVIVKLSQNVLLGLAAFLLATWWTFRDRGDAEADRPSYWVIWERFPKFVLGFVAASLLFSFLLSADTAKETGAVLKGFRTLWFALAFTCIGLETRFVELLKMEGGRPAIAFIIAQAFNVVWTLGLAYLLFS